MSQVDANAFGLYVVRQKETTETVATCDAAEAEVGESTLASFLRSKATASTRSNVNPDALSTDTTARTIGRVLYPTGMIVPYT